MLNEKDKDNKEKIFDAWWSSLSKQGQEEFLVSIEESIQDYQKGRTHRLEEIYNRYGIEN